MSTTHAAEVSRLSVDVAAIRKAPVGRVATLSADLFNGPDPVPGIEVELPPEQVKASTIGADVALVPPADLAALCDEVDALRAALAAKDVENERLRGALGNVATECDYCEPVARAALADGEATG